MSRGQVCQIEGSRWRVLADVGGIPNGLTEGADGTLYVAQAGASRPLDPPRVPSAACRRCTRTAAGAG